MTHVSSPEIVSQVTSTRNSLRSHETPRSLVPILLRFFLRYSRPTIPRYDSQISSEKLERLLVLSNSSILMNSHLQIQKLLSKNWFSNEAKQIVGLTHSLSDKKMILKRSKQLLTEYSRNLLYNSQNTNQEKSISSDSSLDNV